MSGTQVQPNCCNCGRPTSCPTIFTDNFNRTGAVGSNWAAEYGSWACATTSGGQLTTSAPYAELDFQNGTYPAGNAQVDISGTGQFQIGIGAAGSYLAAELDTSGAGTFSLVSISSGTGASLSGDGSSLTGGSPSLTVTALGGNQWTVAISGSPTGGTYSLALTAPTNFNILGSPQTATATVNWNDVAATVASDLQTAIRTLTGLSAITVSGSSTGSSPNFTHTLTVSGLPSHNVTRTVLRQCTASGSSIGICHDCGPTPATLTVDSSDLTGGTPSIVVTQISASTWTVAISGSPTGGSYDLTFKYPSFSTAVAAAATVSWNASGSTVASVLQTAIDAAFGNSVTVSGSSTGTSPNYTHTISVPAVTSCTGGMGVSAYLNGAVMFTQGDAGTSACGGGIVLATGTNSGTATFTNFSIAPTCSPSPSCPACSSCCWPTGTPQASQIQVVVTGLSDPDSHTVLPCSTGQCSAYNQTYVLTPNDTITSYNPEYSFCDTGYSCFWELDGLAIPCAGLIDIGFGPNLTKAQFFTANALGNDGCQPGPCNAYSLLMDDNGNVGFQFDTQLAPNASGGMGPATFTIDGHGRTAITLTADIPASGFNGNVNGRCCVGDTEASTPYPATAVATPL